SASSRWARRSTRSIACTSARSGSEPAMMFRDLAVATHLIGMALWVGGAAVAAFVAAAGAREGEDGRGALAAAQQAISKIANPGMGLAWLAGLSYLVPNFTTFYAKA